MSEESYNAHTELLSERQEFENMMDEMVNAQYSQHVTDTIGMIQDSIDQIDEKIEQLTEYTQLQSELKKQHGFHNDNDFRPDFFDQESEYEDSTYNDFLESINDFISMLSTVRNSL